MSDTHDASTDLADAILAGDDARVARGLAAAPERIRDVAPSGHRWLSLAARAGHLRVVQVLLANGADPTWPDVDAPGGRALHDAAGAGRRDLVELLLAHGADPNAHVLASGNAVYAGARVPELRALLEAHGGTLDPYDLVWLDEDDEVMRRVLADPASAWAGCGGVYTAVVTRGKHALLHRLLAAGVRVPPTPRGCRTYLLEDSGMLRELLQRGGLDADYPDETGATLLHALCTSTDPAVVRGRAACAEILLAAGARLDAVDADGRTPIDLARERGHHDLLLVFERA